MDRRIRKSKNALKKAMFQLMQKKAVSQISIRELCELADVNRSTFYSNYGNTIDLIKDIHQDFFEHMFYKNYVSNDNNIEVAVFKSNLILDMITYVENNKQEVTILFTNNENNMLEQNLLSFFMDLQQIHSLDYNKSYPFIYHTMAFFTLLHAWVKDGYPCSAQKLSQIIIDNSYPLESILKN